MVEFTIPVSEQLAAQLRAVGDRLPEILELGLRRWQAGPEPDAVQRLRRMLARHGLLAEWEPTTTERYVAQPDSERLSPLGMEGRPPSELIVEERNRW